MAGFKGYVISKTLITDPLGGRYIKIDIVEERENPGLIAAGDQANREFVEMMQNIFRSIPMLNQLLGGKIPIPRISLLLTEDEVEEFGGRLDVGDYVYVRIQGGKVSIEKASE